MAREGVRHLIECHCILPIFRNYNPPVYHKFLVFSIIEEDQVQPKIVQCNNCGILHKVIDLCKSEIVHGVEDSSSLRSIDDIKYSIPSNLSEFLVNQKQDITTWEYVEFIIDNKLDTEIILGKDDKTDVTQIKMLHIKPDGSFKVKSVTRQDVIEL